MREFSRPYASFSPQGMTTNQQQFYGRDHLSMHDNSYLSYDEKLANLVDKMHALWPNMEKEMSNNVSAMPPRPPFQEHNPSTNTYHQGWMDHPSFKWGEEVMLLLHMLLKINKVMLLNVKIMTLTKWGLILLVLKGRMCMLIKKLLNVSLIHLLMVMAKFLWSSRASTKLCSYTHGAKWLLSCSRAKWLCSSKRRFFFLF